MADPTPTDTNSASPALAEALWHARINGTTVTPPTAPMSLDDAYKWQQATLATHGSNQLGWKVGSTSEAAQQRLGTDEPGAGPLLAQFCHPNDGKVPIHRAHDVHIEVEFAFSIAHTLAPRNAPYTRDEVADAVDGMLPALELVGCRFDGGLGHLGRSLVTLDFGANVGFAAGERVDLPAIDSLAEQPCQLLVDDETIVRGTGKEALGNPFNVLVWLANHLRSRDIALEQGSIVTTGTCTGLIAVSPGQRITGDFSQLGKVSIDLIEATSS